jgi:four helix bundle protein
VVFEFKGRDVSPRRRPLELEDHIDWTDGMNNPEVTMHETASATGFDALDKAITAAGLAIRLVMRVPAPLKPIADQVIRSASSVPANVAEGAGRSGRDRAHHWRIAYASAKEVDSHLSLLAISGAVPPGKAMAASQLFDDVRAMTWRLLNPR